MSNKVATAEEKFLALASAHSPLRSISDAVTSSPSPLPSFDQSFAASTFGQTTSTYAVASFEQPIMRAVKLDEPLFLSASTSSAPAKMSEPQLNAFTLSNKDHLYESVSTSFAPAPAPLSVTPRPTPIWFQRSTSFVSSSPASQLFSRIAECLARNPNVTSSQSPADCQIPGELCQSGEYYRFCVSMFEHQEQGQLLIEVELLNGDRFGFNKFFHDLCDDLGSAVQERLSKRLKSFATPAHADAAVQSAALAFALPSLTCMAQSAHTDVAREGARGLAQLSLETGLPVNASLLTVTSQDPIVQTLLLHAH